MTADQKRENADNHMLPGWVNFVQDNLFLSCLILAEAYLLGTLMTLGWVPNIQDPASWGLYRAAGVVLFFLSGAMAAGIALKCSVKAASGFSQGKWGMASFNFLGLIVFAGCEIWASLSERSANLLPTPADKAVLTFMGISHAPVSPTIVIVALLLPFASLYYGFSQQGKAPQETEDERTTRETNELASAKHKQELALVKARGRRQQMAAYLTREPDAVPDATPDADEPNQGGQEAAPDGVFAAGNDEPSSEANEAAPGTKAKPLPKQNLRELPKDMWKAHDLGQYVLMRYNITLSQTEAAQAIAGLPERTRAEGVRGQPYCAPKRAVKAWADKRFATANATQASAD